MKTSWDTADSWFCLSWLFKVRENTDMMQDFIKCSVLYYWSWLTVDWPQVSWTYPKPQCWLWVVEDWAARWHSTLQQQALVRSCIHGKCHHCLIFKFEWWRTINSINQGRSPTFWINCLGIMVWCLLRKLIYNVTGRLGLLDYDEVELNNLHRQVLHGEEYLGQPKALSAAHAIRRYLPVLVVFIHIHKCMYCISMCLNKCMYWVSVCLNSAG